jgi:hypothetical protein
MASFSAKVYMNRDDIHKAISDFLDLLDGGKEDAEGREAALALNLDRLALAYHYSEYKFDETDYPDAPRKDYQELREIVSALFPEYGYYNVAARISVEISEGGLHVGDAIDDITDIAIDMDEVLWLWKNTSVDNALWEFKQGYENHWGMHLRCLQLYILANSRGA